MDGLNRITLAVLGLSALWLGCAFPGATAEMAVQPEGAQLTAVHIEHPPQPYLARNAAAQTSAEPPPAWPSQPVASSPATASPPTTSPASVPVASDLHEVVAELEAIGALDPAKRNQLLADLHNADPTLRPMIVQGLRASLAQRRRAQAVPSVVAQTSPGATDASRFVETAWPGQLPPASPFAAQGSPAVQPLPATPPQAEQTPPTVNGANVAQTNAAAQSAIVERAEHQPPGDAHQVAAGPQAAEPAQSGQAGGAIQPVSFDMERSPENWAGQLTGAIATLENASREPPHNAAQVRQQVYLRMLYLAAGRNDEALRPIPGISASQQDFWTQQLYGLATYLDTQRIPDSSQRAAEARSHLDQAMVRLAENGTLVVRNLAFCTEVSSYGIYSPFKEYQFKPGQPLLLYAEVENFKSDETPKGFHTALRSSYQILDGQGRRVDEQDLALTEEYCQNARRDYFIRYFLSVPQRIYQGKYTLQLTIEDTLSQKIGQSTIEFTVEED